MADLAASEERVQQLAQLESSSAPKAGSAPSNSVATQGPLLDGVISAEEGDTSLDPSMTGPGVRKIAQSGAAHTTGGSREAAMLRGMLLRFDHHSFELGMGPQQITQLLELLSRDVQEVADAVISSITPQEASNISEDYVMPPSNPEDHAPEADSDMNAYVHRLDISSHIMQLVFSAFMARPLAAVQHPLSCLEQFSQAVDKPNEALLASLLQGQACRDVHAALLKAHDGTSGFWNDIIQAGSLEFGQQLNSVFQCSCVDVETLVYRSILVGCMVPAAHPSLRLYCTAASLAESGLLHPFNAANHTQVHEVPGLDPAHPAAHAVVRTLLPGVGFAGEAERIIRERVVTLAKDPCPE